jgi:hypothetical protein
MEGANDVQVTHSGKCRLSSARGRITVGTTVVPTSRDHFQDRIGGRPAAARPDGSMVEVLLRDDADTVLQVSAPDPAARAERLVPLLTG